MIVKKDIVGNVKLEIKEEIRIGRNSIWKLGDDL